MFKPHQLVFVFIAFILWLSPSISNNKPTAFAQSSTAERERGIAWFRQGEHSRAIANLKKVVKEDKKDYEAWRFLGLAQIQIDDLKNATKSLQTAVTLRPDFAPAHVGLGYVALLQSKWPEAISEARLAVDLDPKIPEAHYVIGAASIRTGAREEAVKRAEAAMQLDPRYAAAYLLKSQALVSYLNQNEITDKRRAGYLEAATYLEKYLELEPDADYKQTWLSQIKNLRFYSSDPPFSGKFTRRATILARSEPAYTDDARNRRVTGTVILRCILAADGTVKHPLIIEGLPDGLTEASIAAVQRIKFNPALLDGKPVSTFVQIEYHFHLY